MNLKIFSKFIAFLLVPFRCYALPGDRHAMLFDEFDDIDFGGGGGGAASAVKELSDRVTKGMGAIVDRVKGVSTGLDELKTEQTARKTKEQELWDNHTQLSSDFKKALEDFTNIKNAQNDIVTMVNSYKNLANQFQLEMRGAHGDPIKGIVANEEKRLHLNTVFRHVGGFKLNDEQQSHVKAISLEAAPGSAFLNDALSQNVYDLLESYGKWSTLGVEMVPTKVDKWPVNTAGAVASYLTGGSRIIGEDSAMDAAVITLSMEILGSLILVNQEALDDPNYDISALVLKNMIRAINKARDISVFQGDGTEDGTHAGKTGVFEGGTAAVAAATHTTVESMSQEDWTAVQLACKVETLGRNPKWWMHPWQLIRSLAIKDGNGRSLFQTALEVPNMGSVGSILGGGVELVNAAPSANTTSSKIAAYGDPDAFVVGVRKEIELEQSEHFKFNAYQRAYRAVARDDAAYRDTQGIAILINAAA